MSCCGGPRPNSSIRVTTGSLRIEYLGARPLIVRTGSQERVYRFSPASPIQWLSAMDARRLLRSRWFRVAPS